MVSFPFILAHGSLGAWDEMIFLAIGAIFFGVMFISWWRSRGDDFEASDLRPQIDDDQTQSDERFELE